VNPHEELRALVQRYARAADDRDIDALERIFHPDAVIDGTRGTMSRSEWLDTMRGPRTFPTSMHVLGDPLIDMGESGSGATLDTYGVVYQIGDRDAGQSDLTLGMRYIDNAVRYEGHWVVRHRVARTIWAR
jgi:hypothetical protein